MKRFILSIAALAFILSVPPIISACGGGSASASSGVTLAQFNALKAQVDSLETAVNTQQGTIQGLQTSIASLKNVRIVIPYNGNAPTTSSAITYATSSTTTSASAYTWTFCGYPSSADPANTNVMCVQTDTGYYLLLTQPCQSGSECYISRWKTPVAFTGAGCTGTPYVMTGSGFTGNPAGVVFTLDPQIPQGIDVSAGDYSNPAYYWYVPANEAGVIITMVSQWSPDSGCQSLTGQAYGYQAAPNDASVTHAASEPRVGPSTPSSP